MDPLDDVVFAQARLDVFRPDRWVTVAAGASGDVVPQRGRRPVRRGRTRRWATRPTAFRVHTPRSDGERAQAMADIAVTSAWGKVPTAG